MVKSLTFCIWVIISYASTEIHPWFMMSVETRMSIPEKCGCKVENHMTALLSAGKPSNPHLSKDLVDC